MISPLQMATFIDILKKWPDFREFLVIAEGPKFEYQNMILGYTNTSHPIIHCMEEYLFQFCFYTISSHLWPWGPDPAVARSFSWFQWGQPLSPKPWSWDLKPITTWRPSSRRSMAAVTEGLVMAAWCPDCWGKTENIRTPFFPCQWLHDPAPKGWNDKTWRWFRGACGYLDNAYFMLLMGTNFWNASPAAIQIIQPDSCIKHGRWFKASSTFSPQPPSWLEHHGLWKHLGKMLYNALQMGVFQSWYPLPSKNSTRHHQQTRLANKDRDVRVTNKLEQAIFPIYPLANVYITMENHHFQWVNP